MGDSSSEEEETINVKKTGGKTGAKYLKEEKMLLMTIIYEVKDQVECTKTDAASNKLKSVAWNFITEEYRILSVENGLNTKRSEASLFKCWTNLKYKCRKAISKAKQELLATGGGPKAPPHKDQDLFNQVKLIMPSIDSTVEHPFDSTGQFEEKSRNINIPLLRQTAQELATPSPTDKRLPLTSIGNITPIKRPAPADITEPKKRPSLNLSQNMPNKTDENSNVIDNTNSEKSPIAAFILNNNNEALGSCFSKWKENLIAKASSEKNKIPSGIEMEQVIRIHKLQQSLVQQEELHKEKMKAARFETALREAQLNSLKATFNEKLQ